VAMEEPAAKDICLDIESHSDIHLDIAMAT